MIGIIVRAFPSDPAELQGNTPLLGEAMRGWVTHGMCFGKVQLYFCEARDATRDTKKHYELDARQGSEPRLYHDSSDSFPCVARKGKRLT